MKKGPKLGTKVYWKPTHSGLYLYFNSRQPHQVKRRVIHSLICPAKVICQDQEFNNKIKNITHDLMLNGYAQGFVDSVKKPSRRNRPSSDTIYQGTVIIPYVRSIFKKFRCIGNRFNLRTIFRTKHTLRGILMKTGRLRDAQQTKQRVCVYSIPCDCGRCYIDETCRCLEVCIKEHKYDLTQGLFEKSKLAQHAYEYGHKICGKEAKVLGHVVSPATREQTIMEERFSVRSVPKIYNED
jgi:hypothetical protein